MGLFRSCFGQSQVSVSRLSRLLCVGENLVSAPSRPPLSKIRDSIVVSISACHADDPGSIPGRGVFVGESPTGSAAKAPLAGLEPAIFGLEVRRVIHYATRALLPVKFGCT